MNCEQIRERFGAYLDADDSDKMREQVKAHVSTCDACADELRMWEESSDLIRHVSNDSIGSTPQTKLSFSVMERIYQEDSWRIPVASRTYQWTQKFRRNMIACMAFLLALFVISFLAAAVEQANPAQDIAGLSVPVTAPGIHHSGESNISFKQMNILMASISDPPVLGIEAVPQNPNYYLALSLLGMVSILLIMNWLSRIRQ